ncbi:MAG: hypothetical protein K9L58_04735 [Candidatus Omnitrophica bacterium]|nr:hypothetical protein [Candidatus Omnitrophota bacterium]
MKKLSAKPYRVVLQRVLELTPLASLPFENRLISLSIFLGMLLNSFLILSFSFLVIQYNPHQI